MAITSAQKVSQIAGVLHDIEMDSSITDMEKWEHLMNIHGWVWDMAQSLDVDDETRACGL